jgi:hypothetical protein
MDTNLFKVSAMCWVVTSAKHEEPQVFESVDAAAMHLESVGVPDEEIDTALIDMSAKGNTRANFGVTNGSFIYSDNTRFNELLGVA